MGNGIVQKPHHFFRAEGACGEVNFVLRMNFQVAGTDFVVQVDAHTDQPGFQLLQVLAFLCAEALFAAAKSFHKVRGKKFEEISLAPVENADVIAGFDAPQWCSRKRCHLITRPN